MEPNTIINPIRKYFKTLEYTGFINASENKILLLLVFLYQYTKYMSDTNIELLTSEIYKFYNCLYKQSCFIDTRLENITVNCFNY